MIAGRKEFYTGLSLMVVFTVILVVMFMPLLSGKNALEYLDALYNSISKGSAYYIPKVRKEAKTFDGKEINVELKLENERQAEQTKTLFEKSGAGVSVSGATLAVKGDLGRIFENSLMDADNMYHNKGNVLSGKYGQPERKVLYLWWKAFKALDLTLKKQKRFEAATMVDRVTKKAVESAYNYYGIEPQKISERLGVVIFSLIFYVAYTLWYGFAILYMFEGWGLRLGH